MATETVPSEGALKAAASVASRVSNRSLQLRRAFVVADSGATPPPMTQLLRGGRGGEVRLKLLLSLLWFAANPPYDASYPARSWAQLLDLRDPEKAGARRVTEALAWLEERQFVQLQSRPGMPSRVTLRNELGEGAPYEVPGAVWRRLNSQGSASTSDLTRRRERYIQMPASFWKSGWLALLDGAAVAMFLVLLAERPDDRSRSKSPIWFSPAEATRRYGLSAATRTKGLSQLARADLIDVSRLAVGDDPFDVRRRRNGYFLIPAMLEAPATTSTLATDRMAASNR